MAGKSYEKADAWVFKWPGDDDKIIFADRKLREREIFRGPAKRWRGFTNNDGFVEFLNTNNISSEMPIAIAEYGDTFAVIEV